MIDELHVTNVALIADATVEPCSGLTVLTGETGAGKSALLSSIKLLVGDRASGDQVRDGAEGLSVEGRLFFSSDAGEFPDGHVAQRRVTAEGRSRCSIDGSMATVGQLAQLVGSSVDLCGQHDHQKLLVPANHLGLLDAWAIDTVKAPMMAYREAWEAAAKAWTALEQVLAARNDAGARVEEARFALARIEEVDPKRGEYEELERVLPRLEHGEALAQAANAAYEGIQGEGGALDALNESLSVLEGVSSYDPALEQIVGALREAVFPVEDLASALRRYRDDVDYDPEALAQASSRMGELVGLMRSFGPAMANVFERWEEARDYVGLVDDSEERERQARAALDAAESRLAQAAELLSKARQEAAPRFAAQVTEQMGRLEMGGAELLVDVSALARSQWTKGGADRVEFLYRAGAAMAPRPFAKIASGGEVSRVMLSIKVALGSHDDVETLVFDEIDAGVGGSTARAIASVLSDLAATHQVIVVTHLAQIAVVADRHYVVSKAVSALDGRPETRITVVEGEARVREIARMLSGEDDVQALDHARGMLERAHEA